MKNSFVCLIAVGLIVTVFGFLYFNSANETSAQKNAVLRWEYCAVTTTFIADNTENQSLIRGGANICYLQTAGCQNEIVNAEVIYSKFLQDFRLENVEYSKILASNHARDLAFSKAVAKLGAEGWEIVSSPTREFDDYIPTTQGTYNVSVGMKETKPDVYFKRIKP